MRNFILNVLTQKQRLRDNKVQFVLFFEEHYPKIISRDADLVC